MPRLIDADKLRKDVLDMPNCYNGFSDTYDKAMIIDLIDEQPTVDIDAITESHEKIGYDKGFRDGYAQATSEARYGHWKRSKFYKNIIFCDECGEPFELSNGIEHWNYCPNCGAKMDEVEDGSE